MINNNNNNNNNNNEKETMTQTRSCGGGPKSLKTKVPAKGSLKSSF